MPKPTPEQWERLKGEIYDLYLVQDIKLKNVRKILLERHQHDASIRMFKSRLKSWGFQAKNVKTESWQAMHVIDRLRTAEGKQTIFWEINKGRTTGPLAKSDINKHFRRDKKQPPSTANEALGQVKLPISLAWTTPPSSPILAAQKPRLSSRLSKFLTENYNDLDRHYHIPTATLFPDSDQQSPLVEDVPTPSNSDSEESRLSSDFGRTPQSSAESSVECLVDDFRDLALKLIQPDIHRLSKDDELRLNRLLAGASDSCKRSTSVPRIVERGSRLAIEYGKLSQPLSVACDWAVHIFMAIWWLRKDQPDRAAASRVLALASFRVMLKTANKCLFTNLSWLVTILSSHGLETLLREVLFDCCNTIDAEGLAPNFGALYRYSLAVLTDNPSDKAIYGSQLEPTHKYIKLIWQDEPSSAIICGYFVAWHALETGKTHDAISRLRHCLIESEHHMGKYHLATINCLSILHRAYWESGQKDLAINTLHDAITRCEEATGKQSPYRSHLMSHLAGYFWELHELAKTEQIFWEVLQDQKEFMGLIRGDEDSSRIYWTVQKLEEVLVQQGKSEQASQFIRDITEQRREEWRASYYVLPERDLGGEKEQVVEDMEMR